MLNPLFWNNQKWQNVVSTINSIFFSLSYLSPRRGCPLQTCVVKYFRWCWWGAKLSVARLQTRKPPLAPAEILLNKIPKKSYCFLVRSISLFNFMEKETLIKDININAYEMCYPSDGFVKKLYLQKILLIGQWPLDKQFFLQILVVYKKLVVLCWVIKLHITIMGYP